MIQCEVCHDLSENAGEFEAMSRQACGKNNSGIFGVSIDEEMFVGGHGVEANGMTFRFELCAGDP